VLPRTSGRAIPRVDRDDAMRLSHQIELPMHKRVYWFSTSSRAIVDRRP
jgi:hypothetical protein